MANVVYKGNTGVTPNWQSGEIEYADMNKSTLVYTGRYELLKGYLAPKGGTVQGPDGLSYKVQSSRLEPRKGGLGKLTIFLGREEPSSGGSEGGDPPPVTLTRIRSVQMAQIEKSILTHKKYKAFAEVLELWKNSPASYRVLFKYQEAVSGSDPEIKDLPEGALPAARLILRGVESYLVFAPVVTITTETDRQPRVEGLGKISTPTGGVPWSGNYKFLKTGDNIQENSDGSWTRVEQWTGAEDWSTDLYD